MISMDVIIIRNNINNNSMFSRYQWSLHFSQCQPARCNPAIVFWRVTLFYFSLTHVVNIFKILSFHGKITGDASGASLRFSSNVLILKSCFFEIKLLGCKSTSKVWIKVYRIYSIISWNLKFNPKVVYIFDRGKNSETMVCFSW